MKEFSKNLKTLRAKQGLSQKELADQLMWNVLLCLAGKLKIEAKENAGNP